MAKPRPLGARSCASFAHEWGMAPQVPQISPLRPGKPLTRTPPPPNVLLSAGRPNGTTEVERSAVVFLEPSEGARAFRPRNPRTRTPGASAPENGTACGTHAMGQAERRTCCCLSSAVGTAPWKVVLPLTLGARETSTATPPPTPCRTRQAPTQPPARNPLIPPEKILALFCRQFPHSAAQ
jgi:hypothetical protein